MITRKIKIGKFFYSHSRSIQIIAHHIQSKKHGVISEGGGVCMSFFVTGPQTDINFYIRKKFDINFYIRLI